MARGTQPRGAAAERSTTNRPDGVHVPVRTCVGCRAAEPVSEAAMLRVVSAPGGGAVLPDEGRRAPGRGAWVHLDTECLRKALERKAFPRALRLGIDADTSALHGLVAAPGDESISPAADAGEEE